MPHFNLKWRPAVARYPVITVAPLPSRWLNARISGNQFQLLSQLGAWFTVFVIGTDDVPQIGIGTAGDPLLNNLYRFNDEMNIQLKNYDTGTWFSIVALSDPAVHGFLAGGEILDPNWVDDTTTTPPTFRLINITTGDTPSTWIYDDSTGGLALEFRSNAAVVDTVATPVISPVSGSYAAAQSVTITCATEDAVIRYTIDDTEVTVFSTEYTAPISIGSPTTVRARAFKTNMLNSVEASASYTFTGATFTFYWGSQAGTTISGTTGMTTVTGALSYTMISPAFTSAGYMYLVVPDTESAPSYFDFSPAGTLDGYTLIDANGFHYMLVNYPTLVDPLHRIYRDVSDTSGGNVILAAIQS